jgi:flagellar motility protein MotE (MotC chaperone)
MNIYHDLCLEIEAYELRCEQLEKETAQIFNLMNRGPKTKLVASYSGMPNGNSNDTTLDKLYQQMLRVEEQLNTMRDVLSDKKIAKRQIEGKMSQFETLEGKVAYMRDVEGIDLLTISIKLNYTYDWIRKVSARTSRLRERDLIRA